VHSEAKALHTSTSSFVELKTTSQKRLVWRAVYRELTFVKRSQL